MSDELHNKIIRLGSKPFRRKRKHLGETWKPDKPHGPNIAIGLWCPACRTIHAYRSPNLGISYDRRQGVWYMNWYCRKTGNGLKETPLPTARG